jgi:hypothetical protein
MINSDILLNLSQITQQEYKEDMIKMIVSIQARES